MKPRKKSSHQVSKKVVTSHSDGLNISIEPWVDLLKDDFEHVAPSVHPEKGRIVLAAKTFTPGEVVFADTAVSYGNWYAHKCMMCDTPHETARCDAFRQRYAFIPEVLRENWGEVEQSLAEIEAFGELDRVRSFVKCLAMAQERPDAFKLLTQLTAANYTRCMNAIKKLGSIKFASDDGQSSAALSQLLPQDISSKVAASILSVLNTNSHELEDLGGSGLFLKGCLMEHSCFANCNFSTEGTQLRVVAISNIPAGTPLSIDYANLFYRPVDERKQELSKIYNFDCTCPACTILPDKCRSFVCPRKSCKQGIVSPVGTGQVLSQWTCDTCGYAITPSDRKKMLAAESALTAADLESLDDIESAIEAGVLHRRHHSIFWALEGLAKDMASDTSAYEPELVVSIWQAVLKCLDGILPPYHNERAIYYDAFAQVLISMGNISAAKQAYKTAYEVSSVCSGADSKATKQLKALWEQTPTNVEDLMYHYKNVQDAMEEADAESVESA